MAARAARGRIEQLIAAMIAGQCALAVVAAVHGARSLFLVGRPLDIHSAGTPLAWVELGILALLFACYARGVRADDDLEIAPGRLFAALGIVTFLAVLQVPTTSRDVYAYVAIGRVAVVFGSIRLSLRIR